MKLDRYEVPVGTSGMTVSVNTVNIFDADRIIKDSQTNNIKKIKTKKEQVKSAREDFLKTISLNRPVGSPVESVSATPVNEVIVEPDFSKKYSFEAEDKPVVSAAYQTYQKPVTTEVYRNDTMTQYSKLYEKLDPVEKLRADFEKTEVGSYAHKVLKIGISKVSKYDGLLEENDRKHVALEEQLRTLQLQIEANKKERTAIENEKREQSKMVSDAYNQACQLDAYDKASKEAEIKREQEEAARKAQLAAEQRASAAKRAEMLARIPSELQEEPAKKPVAVQKQDAFSKFKNIEENVEKFDFSKGRAA